MVSFATYIILLLFYFGQRVGLGVSGTRGCQGKGPAGDGVSRELKNKGQEGHNELLIPADSGCAASGGVGKNEAIFRELLMWVS